jgi:hypothetical protein
MKKFFYFLFAFVFLAISAQAQVAVKTKYSKTVIGNQAAAGVVDTTVIALDPQNDYSIQIRPRLGGLTLVPATPADSIYTSVKLYVSNSSADPSWTQIACNDTYTTGAPALADTLVTANASLSTFAAWKIPTQTDFAHARLKVVLTTLAKTNETNYYYIYFVAKPANAYSHMY